MTELDMKQPPGEPLQDVSRNMDNQKFATDNVDKDSVEQKTHQSMEELKEDGKRLMTETEGSLLKPIALKLHTEPSAMLTRESRMT